MSEKTKTEKKVRTKLKKSISRQKTRMGERDIQITQYMIEVFKEGAPGVWETLKKSEPGWMNQFLETFRNGSEIITKKLSRQGKKWSDLSETGKKDLIEPFVKNCVSIIVENNKLLEMIKNEKLPNGPH
jgi:hypothetical protein